MADNSSHPQYFTPEEAQNRPEGLTKIDNQARPYRGVSAPDFGTSAPTGSSSIKEEEHYASSLDLKRAEETAKKKRPDVYLEKASRGLDSYTFTSATVNYKSWTASPPSKLTYYALTVLAFWADVLGIAFTLADITGIALVFTRIIKFFISAFSFVVSWMLSTKLNDARKSADELLNEAKIIQSRIQMYIGYAERIAKFARKTKVGQKILRSTFWRRRVIGTGNKKTIKAAISWLRDPKKKSIFSGILGIIPIIDLLPWYTINVVWTYFDHRKAYRESLLAHEEFLESSKQENEILGEVSYQEMVATAEQESSDDSDDAEEESD